MSLQHLFSPTNLGGLTLPHRIIMAPLTRSRSAQPGDIPHDLNADYYQQRSSAALIISEAAQISPQAKGYAFTPGIHSEQQIQGWKKVTNAVHAAGSHIYLQLFHGGRVSHSALQIGGALPVAPSAIALEGQAFTEEGMLDFEKPRALDSNEIPEIVEQYRDAAINAKNAGFDGVEIHAANGYLLDQFLQDSTNLRDDHYGGSIENRVRLVLEVVEAVTEIWGGDCVGVRISPTGTFNAMKDSHPQALFSYLVEQLNPFGVGYLHVVEHFGEEQQPSGFDFQMLRKAFNGIYIANGGYTAEKAEESLKNGHSDLISFGSLYISNPDLPQRFQQGVPLTLADQSTFYGGDAAGYTDYSIAT